MCRLTFLLFLSFVLFPLKGYVQQPAKEPIAAVVELDSLVVIAQHQGFNVEDFLRYVQEDQSFLTAFRNLRKASFWGEHEMEFDNGRDKAGYTCSTIQTAEGKCRSMEIVHSTDRGNFFRKNGEYRFITAKMYDRVFFTHGRVCDTVQAEDSKPVKGLEKYYEELKKFIFQAGEKVEVPFIGGKTAIFSPKLQSYYDYRLKSAAGPGEKDCYLFQVAIKPQYESEKERKTIVKSMETWFERSTMQVVQRTYHMQYQGPGFRFDVRMHIELAPFEGTYYPELVRYAGEWDIPFHNKEKGRFEARLTRFAMSP
ncbi:MAG: hypothetical protein KBG02_14215 [Haliscomenobacter sp.]|nr:hypothetical protein [Haliscomenobacter sp.]MBP9078018.1 hypothetical protein [Haliscomenobacter sp.]